ncbi:MAG: hypothetical protein PHU04_01315 [Candidatus Peribacteraceae bacterium]|nr:hypothetical protein [Candidatus Peribacteraceae bacterium]
MEPATLSSFAIGILTAFLLFALAMGSLHLRSKTDASSYHGAYRDAQEDRPFPGMAEQLGLSREELRGELDKGKSMMEIARERNVELRLPPRWMDEAEKQEFLQSMAARMGMSVEELRQELSAGKRLMDIADEHGVVMRFPESEEKEPLPR